MSKISDVLARAWDLQRHRAGYSCTSIGNAFQQMQALDETLRTDLVVEAVRFYTQIALIDTKQNVIRGYGEPSFWNNAAHHGYQEERIQMLWLAWQSALRYEAYLYAREHDIPWDRRMAYKE